MAALRENGYAELVPFGENTRYDLPARNNQRTKVRFAVDYEIGRVDIHAPESQLQLGRVDEVVG